MSRRAFVIYAFFVALFGVFCYFAHRYDYFSGDLSFSLWLQKLDFSGARPLMQFLPYALILGVLIALRLWLRPRWRAVVFMAITGLAAGAATWVIKLLVNRPRPDIGLVAVMEGTLGSGFPSGHTACGTVICGFLFYLAPRLVKTPAVIWLLRALLIALIVFTGVSRIYLGAHWASGVGGGLFLGALILYPAIVLYKKYEAKNA